MAALIVALVLGSCGAAAGAPDAGSTTTSCTATACGYQGSTTVNTAILAVLTGSQSSRGTAYRASGADESAVCVGSGASLLLDGPSIVTTGATSSTDASSSHGLNAAAVAHALGTLTIDGGTIATSGLGASGVFVSGDATGFVSGTVVTIRGDNGHAFEAAGGGALLLEGVTATTSGQRASVVATDRGGGTISVYGGTFTASGDRSAGLYSTGVVTATDAVFIAGSAEAVVVEGPSAVTLINCTLASANTQEERGILLYQRLAGEPTSGTGILTMKGGSFTWSSSSSNSATFVVTNTSGVINLDDVTIISPTGRLLEATAGRWGTGGSNGAQAMLNATHQRLSGDLVADGLSTVAVNLTSGSSLTGAINAANTAAKATLALEGSSTWTATGSSYLTSLAGVALNSGTVTNIVGTSSGTVVCYRTKVTDTVGKAHTSGTYSLSGGGTLTRCPF